MSIFAISDKLSLEHGGYKIGTKVGQIKGYMSRN
jgi:hypothetical protein